MSTNKFKLPRTISETKTEPGSPAQRGSILTIRRKDLASTVLADGIADNEPVARNEKIGAVVSTVDELVAYIGVIKAEHFDATSENKLDTTGSVKLFLFARLTQIQESLLDICTYLCTPKKSNSPVAGLNTIEQRSKELEQEIENMEIKGKPCIIPGTSVLEAQLLYARALCRRAELQIISAKTSRLGLTRLCLLPEEQILSFFSRLSSYFISLAIHTLRLQAKEPMKRAKIKKILKNAA